MTKLRKNSIVLIFVILIICTLCQPAFAVTEAEVQEQVEAVGKESVTSNVFIWFLCAIAFLKVSQKIDSFMSSLGINVGNTGGSMLTELMLAARSFSGMKSTGSKHTVSSGTKDAGTGFLAGGIAGAVGRKVTSSAVKAVTTQDAADNSGPGSVGARLYNSSLSKNGDFANKVIGTVASGNISDIGTITGEKAENALKTYMPVSEGIKRTGVEIGGGRITGTEISSAHPEGVAFGMYNTKQYMSPTGEYSTVQAADGTTWYKQYAQETTGQVNSSHVYNDLNNKTLPDPPKRKDKI